MIYKALHNLTDIITDVVVDAGTFIDDQERADGLKRGEYSDPDDKRGRKKPIAFYQGFLYGRKQADIRLLMQLGAIEPIDAKHEDYAKLISAGFFEQDKPKPKQSKLIDKDSNNG